MTVKACLIDKKTKVCTNIVVLNNYDDFVPYDNIVLAEDHSGSIGWIWKRGKWVDPNAIPITDEILASLARRKRNNLLKQTVDVINPLRWETFSEEERDAWREYRQALLDIPQQPEFPKKIDWPEKPSFHQEEEAIVVEEIPEEEPLESEELE